MDNQKEALDFLTRTAEAIAKTFGPSCETLVHDMSKPGHPIVVIFNSKVSGRKVGSSEDIYGGGETAETKNVSLSYVTEDSVNTSVITRSGKFVKSTTVQYKGKGFHYALGINFDYSSLLPLSAALQEFTSESRSLSEHMSSQRTGFMEEDFSNCVKQIGKPTSAMKKKDKVQLVELLMDRKFFDLQKSVSFAAERLGVSRYTMYKYIHEVEEYKGK